MHTKTYLLAILLTLNFTKSLIAQEKEKEVHFYENPQYFASINGTLVSNPDWVPGNKEDGESMFDIGGILIRNGIELYFTDDVSAGVGVGVDFQFNEPYGRLFTMPLYFKTKIHLMLNRESPFFIKGGIGKLLKIGKAFEKGNYYNFGLGYDQIGDYDDFDIMLLLEYHRKIIPAIVSGKVDSISVGIGITFY